MLSKYSFSDISAMPCRFSSAPEEPSRACRLGCFFGKAGRIGNSLPVVVVAVVVVVLMLVLMSMSIISEEADADECSKWSLGVITLLERDRDRDRGFCCCCCCCCRGVDGFCCLGVVGVRNRGVVVLGWRNRGVDSLRRELEEEEGGIGPNEEGSNSSLRDRPVLVLGDGGTADRDGGAVESE